MASIFTKIVQGDIPAYKVAETDDFLAFLDIRPMKKGHTLCIPKKEVDYLFDLSDDVYLGLHIFAREVARAIEKVVPCKRIGTAVVGLEVPHVHIHLIPLDDVRDMAFGRDPEAMSHEDMTELATQIQRQLKAG